MTMTVDIIRQISMDLPSGVSREFNHFFDILEEIQEIILKLEHSQKSSERNIYNNFIRRSNEIQQFLKNVITIMSDKKILNIVKDKKIMSKFDVFDFIEIIKIFFIGSIYYSDKLYNYACVKRDQYIQKIFQFFYRYHDLEKHCDDFNKSYADITQLLSDIDKEITNTDIKIKNFNSELSKKITNDSSVILERAVKELSENLVFLIAQKEKYRLIKEGYPTEFNIIKLLSPFYKDVKKNLTDSIPIEFANEFKYYDKDIILNWNESTLRCHNFNIESLIESSAFDD